MSSITIIIPCFNMSGLMNKCVKALEDQTFRNFAVIFINDGSDDDTISYLKHILDGCSFEYDIVNNLKNLGPAETRNNGIRMAKTEYVTFCDADDWYDRDHLRRLYNAITVEKADIVFCGHKVVNDNGNEKLRPLSNNNKVFTGSKIFSIDADSLCMLLVRTSIMRDTLLPDLRNGEDVAVVPLLMAKASKCVVLADCTYNYFRRNGSASESISMNVVDSLIESYKYTRSLFPKDNIQELEFVGVKNLLYPAVINLFSIGYNKRRTIQLLNKFEIEFPNWTINPFLPYLRKYKLIVLRLIQFRMFGIIRIIALIRLYLVKI